jgi:hypothetical protein
MRKYRKVKYHKSSEPKPKKIKTFLIAILTLIIGSTYTYIYLVGKPYIEWAKEGYNYSEEYLKGASAKVVHSTGGLVKEQSDTVPLELEAKTAQTVSPSKDGIKELISLYFGADAKIALAIAECESSLNPKAIGDTHLSKPSIGLFQVSQIYHGYTTEQLLDAEFNVKIAKQIYDKGGWDRWTTYRTGQYLTKLN